MREIITEKLKKSQKIPELGGEIFFIKNLNIHRCVLVADLGGANAISPEEIRLIVTKHQRASWFRGMGFGVLLAVDSVEPVASRFDAEIDIRNRGKGVWQWTILHSSIERVCFGYHTWTHGFITGIFQDILQRFDTQEYRVNDQKAQMDRFMELATKWARHGGPIRQYQEIYPREDDAAQDGESAGAPSPPLS